MLRIADVETPVPEESEVLVKLYAVSLNASDWEGLRGKPLYSRIMGLFRPRRHVLGSDIAGRVEAAGRSTTLFRRGDEVFADTVSHLGGFTEYVCLPESVLARMPAGVTYEQAAALPQAGGDRATGHPRQGTGPARAEGVDQRRGWRLGHVRSSAREASRGRCHRGGQRGEAGVHALSRGGPRHRLHAGRLHQAWAHLRSDSRSSRASFGVRLPGLADARRAVPVCRRYLGEGHAKGKVLVVFAE